MNSSEESQSQRYFVVGMNNNLYILDKNNIVIHLLKNWAGHRIGTDLTLMLSETIGISYQIQRELSIAEYLACRFTGELDGAKIDP
jgi:hypothetical protein